MTASLACAEEVFAPAAVEELVARAAAGMVRDGVCEGDAVAVMLRNEVRFPILMAAARRVGAYAVPLNWHFKTAEVGYILTDCDAKCLFVHADLLPEVVTAVPQTTRAIALAPPDAVTKAYGLKDTAQDAASERWETWLPVEPLRSSPAAPRATIAYTSGTTGAPKGVWRGALTPQHLAQVAEVGVHTFGLVAGVRTLVVTPLYHSAPNVYAQTALAVGELLVIEPRFDAERTLALIESARITHMYLVPVLMHRLLQLPPHLRRRYDLSSLRFVLHGAAPCPPDVKRAMIDWFGPVIHEFYGGSEAGPIASISSPEWLAHPGSVGRPVPHARLLIADAAGNACPAGATGTIYVEQTAYPPFTYRGRDDLRQACAHPLEAGLFTLGDVGRVDDDGYLYLTDRARDMVISGGVNIYPAEIEGVLATMPEVTDCAVFGVPDAEFGEALCAVVQPTRESSLQGTEGADRVRAWLRERIAGYKVPRHVEFATDLPREESGKIFKRRLREPYWREAGRTI